MDGEQEPIAEAEAPIEQAEPNEPQDDLETGQDAGDDGEQPNPDDDLEEFDWNGKKVKGPKGLKDGVLMQADYTRKTQETAAKARELDERAKHIDQQFKAGEEEMNARAALISIDTDLKSYENVDWDAWEAQDLFAAQAGFRKFQQLKEARGQVENFVGEKQNARTVQTQQETAKRLQETRRFAETQIKGWTPEVDAKITEFALGKLKDHGVTWDTLKGVYNPGIYEILHLAYLGHQAINTKPAPTAKPTLTEPLRVVAAKANPPARKDLGSMSMEEYAVYRQKQMGR